MGEVEECDFLRKLLETKCSDMYIRDDDIKNLVAEGISTASTIASCSRDDLLKVLPGRLGIVNALVKTFGEPQHPAEGGSPSKRPRKEAPDRFQSFVQSARKDYMEWEEADAANVDGKSFLSLSVDPYFNFTKGVLLWVRECHRDLKEILVEATASERFIVLGSSGIGKSYFSVFWICYLASKKENVVWKVADDFFLLDFSDEDANAAKAYGPFKKSDLELREVFQNPAAWLIIDGAQEGHLACECHILLPCSTEKKNYKEFAKNLSTTTLYMPVWEEEEICEYLDAFEKRRADYLHMDVPDKKTAMGSFEVLGGVPRFVLCARHTASRVIEFSEAVKELQKDTCLQFLMEDFDESVKKDVVVHIKCGQSTNNRHGKYFSRVFVLASNQVRLRLRERFHSLSQDSVVDFLTMSASSSEYGSYYGYIFELVASLSWAKPPKSTVQKYEEITL